jgi:hypothetical protein
MGETGQLKRTLGPKLASLGTFKFLPRADERPLCGSFQLARGKNNLEPQTDVVSQASTGRSQLPP